MKTIIKNFYICDTCKTEYDTEKEAKQCEAHPITQDKGVKVGDIIKIVKGDGVGRGKVTSVFVFSKDWGHYVWERYWHTVGLTADCLDSWGSRQLTFEDYKVDPKNID